MAGADRFEEFFAAEVGRLQAVAFALTGRRVLAEELAQEAMLVVHRRWDDLQEYDDPAAFARRVVANKSVSQLRRLVAEARALNRVRSRPSVEQAPAAERDDELWSAVRALPPKQAQAVALRYVADLDAAAIAAAMGSTEGAVRVLLHRARTTLADVLGRAHDEETEVPG